MNEKKLWDYNPIGNKNDRITRQLFLEELIDDNIIHIIDVGDDPVFQLDVDIDLLAINKSYKITTIEVKADNYGYSNDGVKRIFLEFISNNNKFSLSNGTEGRGCIFITKSDYLIYFFIKLNSYLIMETKKLQKWLQENVNSNKYQKREAKTKGYDGEVIYKSYGLLVPIESLIDEINAKLKESNINFYEFEKKIS